MVCKWSVNKYAWWDFKLSKWHVPVAQNDQTAKTFLVIKGAQLSLIRKRTVLESFSLVQNPKATRIYLKGLSMAVINKCGDRFRKFKLLFESVNDAEEVSRMLGKYVTIGGVGKASRNSSKEPQTPNRDTLPQIIERLMSSPHPRIPAPESIPENFPLESAVRLCILDPGFPSLVHRVEEILNNFK